MKTQEEYLAWIEKEVIEISYTADSQPNSDFFLHQSDIDQARRYRASLLALRSIVELCNENTDHHLVDKSWILEAIEREFR